MMLAILSIFVVPVVYCGLSEMRLGLKGKVTTLS
jgi:hypothetical protein